MEDKLFRERLAELAELKLRKRPSINDIEPECVFRQGQEHLLSEQDNPTHLLEITRLKPIIKPCEDCGRLCEDRTTTRSLLTFPKRHWRRSCNGCQKVFNPDTQQYDLTFSKAQAFFVTYLKQQDK